MSATSTLPVHPTRSVRRTSGLVLVGNSQKLSENSLVAIGSLPGLKHILTEGAQSALPLIDSNRNWRVPLRSAKA